MVVPPITIKDAEGLLAGAMDEDIVPVKLENPFTNNDPEVEPDTCNLYPKSVGEVAVDIAILPGDVNIFR
jgi:hypothetical protein